MRRKPKRKGRKRKRHSISSSISSGDENSSLKPPKKKRARYSKAFVAECVLFARKHLGKMIEGDLPGELHTLETICEEKGIKNKSTLSKWIKEHISTAEKDLKKLSGDPTSMKRFKSRGGGRTIYTQEGIDKIKEVVKTYKKKKRKLSSRRFRRESEKAFNIIIPKHQRYKLTRIKKKVRITKRKKTKQSHKLPSDAEEKCEKIDEIVFEFRTNRGFECLVIINLGNADSYNHSRRWYNNIYVGESK